MNNAPRPTASQPRPGRGASNRVHRVPSPTKGTRLSGTRFSQTNTPTASQRTRSPEPTTNTDQRPNKLRPGQRIDDAIKPAPSGGTITLEEWHRLRAAPAADVHVVLHQNHATGIVG